MPPMAAGGMQRGVYGRAESPYNEAYLTAAFASGSSDGSATATAASFGVFGMGEETISSGRSPASNNGLVAYTPSRGLISIRGNWPLFPTCDTVVPHIRTVEDMFALLDVIVAADDKISCDFWREQPFVKLPDVNSVRPKTFFDLSDPNTLKGKKIGVPKMYIGGVDSDPDSRKVHTRDSVIDLWKQAKATLEGLGATVIETDFPLVTKFEKPVGTLQNLELERKSAFEDWLDALELDMLVWPCNADVSKADADINEESAKHAWLNGVLYSNGNCAIRQFGIPTVSVPMGVMADTRMPVNLTFALKAYDDKNLIRYAYAFEKGSFLR
ncbi:amidase signature enzyme [Fusarium mundagurra]|uniref:Amidase signature enzyme n=1 Tax=Fusarium mundagurra TaxID=1567541 RepID=A0A8H5XNP8_9HYPO|nr:amidase signature enzyme [Fusarium mundagurra]